MKHFISTETESVYWIEDGAIMFTPLIKGTWFDDEDINQVDEELVGDELIYNPHDPTPSTRTLNDLYAEVREALK